ncbi:hypothetical protein HN446_03110 [bacterium]|jgi:hypothetical protein|nr:hypothetical protein [bacterium]
MNSIVRVFGIFLLCCFSLCVSSQKIGCGDILSGTYDVNKVIVVLYGGDGIEIVTKADCDRNPLGQGKMTPEEIVVERLMSQDAQKLKISVDDNSVDRYLARIQKQFGITSEQLDDIFRAAGYTNEEGREHFRRFQAIQILIEHKVKSKIVIQKEKVEAYYNENPVIQEATCVLQRGVVPLLKNKTEKEQLEVIKNRINQNKILKRADWEEPFSMEKSSVAESMLYLFEKKEGFISEPKALPGQGFEVFRVKSCTPERNIPLSERYAEILDKLRFPLYEKHLEEYKDDLISKASISILDQSYFSQEFLGKIKE